MGIEQWADLNCRLHWVYEGPVPAAGNGRQGVNPEYFAWLLLSGEAEFSFNKQRKVSLRPGSWGFPPLNSSDRFHRFSSDARLISLCFKLEWIGGRNPHPIKNFVSFESARHPALETEARRLVKLSRGFLDSPLRSDLQPLCFERYERMQSSFWRWLSFWTAALAAEGVPSKTPHALDDRLARMLDILYGLRRHGPVPYGRLEEASSLGRVQIDRLFQAQLGASPKGMFERHLLELCKRRLKFSSLSIKELGAELGFQHSPNFSAWFTKNAGMPPQRFRTSA